MMENIRQHFINGVAKFYNAQIPDHKRYGVEIIKTDRPINVNLGKNAHKEREIDYEDVPWNGVVKKGNYFYWYSKPLHNYYHSIYDSLGCLFYYFDIKLSHPDLKLILNKNHRKINKWPPFVKEILDILEIPFEYTDENTVYETVYYGNTLNQNERGHRIRVDERYYLVLDNLIVNALNKNLDVPTYDNIYISRRTQNNPNYNKDLIGEDNTQKRGCVNEDEIVDIVRQNGFKEVFGENYTLAEKITMFSKMKKYITFSGAGVTNTFFRKSGVIGGIGSPGLPFPEYPRHGRHMIYDTNYFDNDVRVFNSSSFVNEDTSLNDYNSPWKINNMDNLKDWIERL